MTGRTLQERGGSLVLVRPQPAVARVLTLMGVDQEITVRGGPAPDQNRRARDRRADRSAAGALPGRLTAGTRSAGARSSSNWEHELWTGFRPAQPITVTLDDKTSEALDRWLAKTAAATGPPRLTAEEAIPAMVRVCLGFTDISNLAASHIRAERAALQPAAPSRPPRRRPRGPAAGASRCSDSAPAPGRPRVPS